jgi:hypothetical protein
MGSIVTESTIESISRIDGRKQMTTDSIYQLSPPLFALGMLRIDSPSSHQRDIYSTDKEFFALHSRRNLYIRTSYMGEFDQPMEMGEWLRVPRLQVLVTKLATGIHQVVPVYRGKSFFYGNDTTDLEILQILVEMSRRGGIDASEWYLFELGYMARIEAAK